MGEIIKRGILSIVLTCYRILSERPVDKTVIETERELCLAVLDEIRDREIELVLHRCGEYSFSELRFCTDIEDMVSKAYCTERNGKKENDYRKNDSLHTFLLNRYIEGYA